MSSESPVLNKKHSTLGKNYRFALIYTQWNFSMVSALCQQVEDSLHQKKIHFDTISVPGALELVYASKKIALTKKYDAIITLGIVIRGDTYHFEYVCQGVGYGLSILNADPKLDTPIVQGVLTINSKEQANERIAANKGEEFVLSAIHMAQIAAD